MAIGKTIKEVINNKTTIRAVSCNFEISKIPQSRHLMKFQEKQILTDFEYTAVNDVKSILVSHRKLKWSSISNRLQNYIMV
jgi:DNA-binding protein YbaB